MPKFWRMISLCLHLLAIALLLLLFRKDNDLAKKSACSQPPKPNDCYSLSSLSPVGSGATECTWPQKVLIDFGSSFTANVAAGISYVHNTYRHLHAASKYQTLIRQYPPTLGYVVRLTLPQQSEAIASRAGFQLDEVPALALALEGPVLSTQEFISAFTEYPLEYALYLWRCWGDGFWPFKLCVSSLIMFYAWWHGKARRTAFHLIMFLLWGYLF